MAHGVAALDITIDLGGVPVADICRGEQATPVLIELTAGRCGRADSAVAACMIRIAAARARKPLLGACILVMRVMLSGV